jgi:hypothetical protein
MAQPQALERRATFTTRGSGNWGKCTIEVVVDGVADVEIRGDRALLRTVSGQLATWRRFECSAPISGNPADFRFTGIDGRGSQDLLQDPRAGRGVAIVRIQDPRSGAEGYTFDVEWLGGSAQPGPPMPPPVAERGRGRGVPEVRGYDLMNAIAACQRAIEQRVLREGYRGIELTSLQADNRPGRNDRVVGSVTALAGGFGRSADLDFVCSIEPRDGSIRALDLNRR